MLDKNELAGEEMLARVLASNYYEPKNLIFPGKVVI